MDWIHNWNFILGSGSPRRTELLKLAGFTFTVMPADIDEHIPSGISPEHAAEFIAQKKADALKTQLKPNDLLITADSVVILNENILGKPVNEKEAYEMLSNLSDEKHYVITGVCLTSLQKRRSFSCTSSVYIEKLTKLEIDHYIARYKPYDKAGSYGIQEWLGINRIKRIQGSYTNIMGLPTADLYDAIKAF